MENKAHPGTSLMGVVPLAVTALSAALAAGRSPKLDLDLEGGLSVVYKTHTPYVFYGRAKTRTFRKGY